MHIVDGRPDQDDDRPSNLDDLILWYRDSGNSSLKDAARIIATDLDISRSRVYQRALSLWRKD